MIEFREILKYHFSKYHLMQKEDVYKLCYQAVFGPGHAIENEKKALLWLKKESENLTENDSDNYENISHDGNLIRVNLYTYLKDGGDILQLNKAFVRSANEVKGSLEVFESYLEAVQEFLIENNQTSITPDDFRNFCTVSKESGYPVLHHSDIYRKEYKPAYRVVLRELLV